MQTKLQSFIEAIANVVIGYIIMISAQLLIFPWFDMNISFKDNLKMGLIFMAISVSKSYLIRRFFNVFHNNRG